MTPAQLKSSILQLAIQGKLVPQIPAEGTGEELYQQIQKEKQALIKSGKIKKEKPLPPIAEDEIPFEIPEGWRWCRIGDIFNLQAGKNITASEINTEPSAEYNYLCYGGNGIRGYVGSFNREGHHALIGRQGSLCGNINYANGKFYATEHAVVVEHFNMTDVIWGGLFLRALNLNQYATATAQPGLAVANIIKVLIPLPPLAEQRRIVAKIEALMPLIDRYDKAWTQIEAIQKKFPGDLKKSILQMAIQGKLVPQIPGEGTGEELYQQIQKEKQALIKSGKIKKEKPLPPIAEDEIPFEIPEGWRWCRLGEIASMCLGKMLDKQKNKGIPCQYLRNVNVRWGDFDLSDLLEMKFEDTNDARYIIQKLDLIMCEGGEPGRCAVWNSNDIIHFQKALHRIRFFESINPFFYYFLFFLYANSGFLNLYFTGTTIKHLTGQALERIPIPLPPLAEQRRIVAKIEELMPLCDRLIRN